MQPPGRPTVIAAIGLNVAGLAAWRLGRAHPCLLRLLYAHGVCSGDHLRRGQVHTLLTSCVSHQGFLHFAGNTWGIFLFGNIAATVLSPRELAALLTISGAGSSVCHSILHPRTPVLGASGALMGLITASAFLDPGKRLLVPGPGITISMLQIADLTFATNVLGLLMLRRRWPTVAWAAHIGGMSAGLGFMAFFRLLRGDVQFAGIWSAHAHSFERDWRLTAASFEASIDRCSETLERWLGR